GKNANDIEGCFDLSNPITVERNNADGCQANGGDLFGGPFSFCVEDGIADNIPEGAITVANSQGENFTWVVTDDAGNILGLPPTFSVVDFDDVAAGVCLVWYLAWDGTITGAEVGMNASDIEGCFDLSNPITVNRLSGSDCDALSTNDFEADFDFAVYPNPTQNEITIDYKGNQNLDLEVVVIDMLGKKFLQTTFSTQRNPTLNLSNLTQGTYFLNITDKNTGVSTTKRIMKN
ncbi:T9SS type A sorting domain-containing protein, partial [Hyunsoonleella sp. 2307UL5-6]|uniref:T9SS type A sorting domain-containing protein n=1 Tax=Hyunsoonleella sp. 2307UL5-6 TaxID=3384768 RepID=UPI0039BC374C